MAFKLLMCLYLIQVLIINAHGLGPLEENPYYKEIDEPTHLDACNETVCSPPCPGAAAPKRCPAVIPYCHFGCACHTDCGVGVVFCFETKDCIETRRFFTKRRRITKMSKN